MSAITDASAPASGPVLRDIHLPPGPSWWPPAPGWWILATLVLLAIVLSFWFWRQRRRRRAMERALLAELDGLVANSLDHPSRLAAGLHQLLRRAALRYETGAGQHRGEAWRHTLAQVPVDGPTLDQLILLEQVMYRPDTPFDADAAIVATRRWLLLAWRRRVPKRTPAKQPARPAEESGHA